MPAVVYIRYSGVCMGQESGAENSTPCADKIISCVVKSFPESLERIKEKMASPKFLNPFSQVKAKIGSIGKLDSF